MDLRDSVRLTLAHNFLLLHARSNRLAQEGVLESNDFGSPLSTREISLLKLRALPDILKVSLMKACFEELAK